MRRQLFVLFVAVFALIVLILLKYFIKSAPIAKQCYNNSLDYLVCV